MATWLESVLAEVKEVSATQETFAEPDEEPGPRDHVVGVAGSDLRKILFLVRKHRKQTLELTAELMLCSSSDRKKKSVEAMRFHTLADVLSEIFWVSCRAAFPDIWDKPSIGIRKGWKVVWSDLEQDLGLPGVILSATSLQEILQNNSGDEIQPPDKIKLN